MFRVQGLGFRDSGVSGLGFRGSLVLKLRA